MDNHLISDEKLKEELICFVHNVLQKYVLNMATTLSEVNKSYIICFYKVAETFLLLKLRIITQIPFNKKFC